VSETVPQVLFAAIVTGTVAAETADYQDVLLSGCELRFNPLYVDQPALVAVAADALEQAAQKLRAGGYVDLTGIEGVR
jgi:hypothetical protein